MLSVNIAMDLGTVNTVIYSKKKGVLLKEPSIIAVEAQTKKVLVFGHEAKNMVGKVPPHILILQPFKKGIIEEYDITAEILKHLWNKMKKKGNFSLSKPNVAVCIPYHSTLMERRAIQEVIKTAGAKEVHVVTKPMAAAVGSDLPVGEPTANMVVDIGGGITESAIIACGGVVKCCTSKAAGNRMDEQIIQHIKQKHNLLISVTTAEQIKREIGYASPGHEKLSMNVKGKSRVEGLPGKVEIDSYEIQETLAETIQSIMATIQDTWEDCPPELAGDVVERGITLSGGGSLLNGLEECIEKEFSFPVQLTANPLEAAAIGTDKFFPVSLRMKKPSLGNRFMLKGIAKRYIGMGRKSEL